MEREDYCTYAQFTKNKNCPCCKKGNFSEGRCKKRGKKRGGKWQVGTKSGPMNSIDKKQTFTGSEPRASPS